MPFFALLLSLLLISACAHDPGPAPDPGSGSGSGSAAPGAACRDLPDGCSCEIDRAGASGACHPSGLDCCATPSWPDAVGAKCACRQAFAGQCRIHKDEPACRCTDQPDWIPDAYWPTHVDSCHPEDVPPPDSSYGAPRCCQFATACQCESPIGGGTCATADIGDGSRGVEVASCSASAYDSCPAGEFAIDSCE